MQKTIYDSDRWVCIKAFRKDIPAVPIYGAYGNLGRNQVIGPALGVWISLLSKTRLSARYVCAQFRVEMFDVLHRFNSHGKLELLEVPPQRTLCCLFPTMGRGKALYHRGTYSEARTHHHSDEDFQSVFVGATHFLSRN
jgi:hypothetical protein